MSGALSEFINITITRETVVTSLTGFGKLLLVGDLANTFNEGFPVAPDRYKEYTTSSAVADLIADGYNNGAGVNAIITAVTEFAAQNIRPTTIAVGYYDSGAAETMTTGLPLIVAEDNSWYCLACTDRTAGVAGDQNLASTWAQSNGKFFITASADTNIKDSAVEATSIAALAKAAGRDHSCIIYAGEAASTTDVKGWADIAWAARMLATTPGSATWCFKALTGINPDDTLDSGERTVITDKFCNMYNTVGGVPMTRLGTVSNSTIQYADVIRFSDWLESDMTTRIFSKMVNLDKIPFNDTGIGIITGEIQASLDTGVANGGIEPDYVISAPKAKDVSAANKGLRLLPDVTFTATGTGAIHGVTINGLIQI